MKCSWADDLLGARRCFLVGLGVSLLLVPVDPAEAQSRVVESVEATASLGVRLHHRNLKWEAGSSRLTFVEQAVLPTFTFSLPLSQTESAVWGVRGLVSSGFIIGGELDDREPHWNPPRHQIAEITGSGADEQELAFFWRSRGPFGLENSEVSVGWGRFRARRRLENGLSLSPREFTLDNLDSRFRSTWSRISLGFATRIPVNESHLEFTGDVRRSDYESSGTWNLRPELRQPLSFAQDGRGWGGRIAASYTHVLGAVALRMGAFASHVSAKDGDDRVFFQDGTHVHHILDRARYRALGIELGFTYPGA